MDSPIQLSEDESFEQDYTEKIVPKVENVTILSSDNSTESYELTSDEDIKSEKDLVRSNAIKKLFPVNKKEPVRVPVLEKTPGFERMIGAVKVHLPVDPYGCQIALISKIITAIKTGQNCLLESPTGSGKTLALLCGVLAWQKQERIRLAALINAEVDTFDFPDKTNNYQSTSSPQKNVSDDLFTKNVFGHKSIYDEATNESNQYFENTAMKRTEPMSEPDSPNSKLVSIHKKRRLTTEEFGENSKINLSPVKNFKGKENSDTATLPTIYYGARTHKQIQQVVKEFRRTSYCGEAQMSVLSSRDYSCIREYDRKFWSSKNDMCRNCVKDAGNKKKSDCEYYDNRAAINHRSLPPAFDLEDLVSTGVKLKACPFYGARAMAQTAHIIFCPYNYLIEAGIRESLSIDLTDKIVIIDEGHNIEDICRDSATFTVTRDHILAALAELEKAAGYRFSTDNMGIVVDKLVLVLKNWDQWYINQKPLLNKRPGTTEAVYTWESQHFVQTLANHNIGQAHCEDFKQSVDVLCRKFKEDPRTLYGVTQSTCTLLEDLRSILCYLFYDNCKYMDDFKPTLIRTVATEEFNNYHWRKSLDQEGEKEILTLRLLCMNPAVIFSDLKQARCVIIASGTLTPMVSFKSELGTDFKLTISPPHVIPSNRVWVGSLTTCPDGTKLECKSRDMEIPEAQDAVGRALLYVCQVTPNGVLCFIPSYGLMNKLLKRWRETDIWQKLDQLKNVSMESRNVKDHNTIMEEYYRDAASDRGALLFAVYRGKVSEGMDFKDEQARAVVTLGVPYPNSYDMSVKEKMSYNDKYSKARSLLSGNEWLRVQAYRALNQALGRCVRHRGDWGAVLMIDARFAKPYFTEHLSKWIKQLLSDNHYTFGQLTSGGSLKEFMLKMSQEKA